MDWLLHGLSTATAPQGFAAMTGPIFKDAGYQHLTDLVRRADVADLTMEWPLSGGRVLRCRLFCDAPATATFGKGIGYHLTDRVPFIMLTREGESAAFAAVYDLAGDGGLCPGAAARLDPAGEMVVEVPRGVGKARVSWDGTGLKVE